MDELWPSVSIIATGVVLLVVAALRARRRSQHTNSWLPKELGDASLAYVERTFRSGGSRPIVARVDRAYRSPRRVITLVELKTRAEDRVYPSDVIELSAQRLALSAETGEAVAPVAFVVVEGRVPAHGVSPQPGES